MTTPRLAALDDVISQESAAQNVSWHRATVPPERPDKVIEETTWSPSGESIAPSDHENQVEATAVPAPAPNLNIPTNIELIMLTDDESQTLISAEVQEPVTVQDDAPMPDASHDAGASSSDESHPRSRRPCRPAPRSSR